MQTSQLVLEYLNVLLSPQVIGGFVVAGFVLIFREDIKALFVRIAKIRLPGGAELSTSQSAKLDEEPKDKKPPLPPPSDAVKLPATLNPPESKEVRELLDAERAIAYLWEYRYLNYFLVPNTQIVIDWLASLQIRPTVKLYDTVWLPAIPSPTERRAILNALQTHYLITIDKELIEVTPKGREYIQWRGPLQLPTAAPAR
jgi:hypothetical protein